MNVLEVVHFIFGILARFGVDGEFQGALLWNRSANGKQ